MFAYTVISKDGQHKAIISRRTASGIFEQADGFFRDSKWKGYNKPAYEILKSAAFGNDNISIVLLVGDTIEPCIS